MEKKKQKPYSDYERQLLIQLVQSKIGVLENRKTDGVSQKKKHEAWEEITTEFNNSNVSHIADSKQLKKMWQNLKAKARDAKTLEAQRKRTGGGPAPPEMGPLEAQIIAVMPNVLPSIDVPIDSDTSAAAAAGNDNDDESWLPKRARISNINEPGTSQEPQGNQDPGRIQIPEASEEVLIPQEPTEILSRATTSHRRNKSFDELKKDLLWQELENNKKKFELEVEHIKKKNELEIEFLQEKYKLELEILLEKKEMLKKPQ